MRTPWKAAGVLLSAAVALSAAGALAGTSGSPFDFPLPRGSPAAAAVKALERLPEEQRWELRLLYRSYADLVSRKLDDGWRAGLLSGELIERPDDAGLPARQLEEALAKRERVLAGLEARLAKAAADPAQAQRLRRELAAVKREAASLRRRAARSKGTCLDWSDAVWAELSKLKPKHWSLRDEARQAPPRHTAALVCAPLGDDDLCLALDPWGRGQADAYEYGSWNSGSFEGRVPAEYFLHHLPEAE